MEDQDEQIDNDLTQRLQKVYDSLNSEQRIAYNLFPTFGMKVLYLEGILLEREKWDIEIDLISATIYLIAIGIVIIVYITDENNKFLLFLAGIIVGIQLSTLILSLKMEFF